MNKSKAKVGAKASMVSKGGADARSTNAKSMMGMMGKKSGASNDSKDKKDTRC